MLATAYDWLMLVHVVAAMVWLGGLVAMSVLVWRILAGGDAKAALGFAATLGVVGPLVFAPALVLVVAAGVAMVADSSAWSFGQTWVVLALVLFAVVFAVGALFQSRAGIGAGRAAEAGDATAAARQLRRWATGNVTILAVLLVITWDMVFKPGL